MKTSSMMTSAMPRAPVGKGVEEVSASFDRFCLAAGIETLGAMMEADAEGGVWATAFAQRGPRVIAGAHGGQDGFHAGKVAIERPRSAPSTGKN